MDRLTVAYLLIAALVISGGAALYLIRRSGHDRAIQRDRVRQKRRRQAETDQAV